MFTDIFAFLYMKKRDRITKQEVMKKKRAKLFEEDMSEIPVELPEDNLPIEYSSEK